MICRWDTDIFYGPGCTSPYNAPRNFNTVMSRFFIFLRPKEKPMVVFYVKLILELPRRESRSATSCGGLKLSGAIRGLLESSDINIFMRTIFYAQLKILFWELEIEPVV